MTDLPAGWAETKLGDVCDVVSGSTPRTAVAEYWEGDIPWITPDDLSGYANKTISRGARSITQAGYDSCATRMLPTGSVLFTSRAPIGYVAIAAQPVCTNQGFKSFVPSDALLSEYLYWYLRHATPEIRKRGSGTTFPELSKTRASDLSIRVPPQAEQRRIVAAIEEQLSRLDAAEALLVRAAKRVANLRTAAIASAVDGHASLPLGELVTDLRYGTSIKCTYEAAGAPVLRIPNIRSGHVDRSDLKFAIDPNVDLSPFRLEVGDLLFVRTNGSSDLIGRVAAVDIADGMAYASYLIRARPDPERLDSRFAVIALSSPTLRSQIQTQAATTAGQYNLNLAALRSLEIPVPAIEKQREIAAGVDRELSLVEGLGETITRALRRSKALRRAVLNHAFAGQLVPQDPSDEPASLLLERIAAKRDAAAAKRRRRTRRATVTQR